MTYEEAIEYFKLAKLSVPKEEDEYFDLAIEALQKQVPMKPRKVNNNDNYYCLCPRCQAIITRADSEFACFNCNQKIDRSYKE